MKTNGKVNNCEFESEIVSYIYDELAAPERAKFERHLAGCSTCTDEFAGISNARFSVFEWQREEFAPLVTPEIVIPYERPVKAVVSTENEGWFAGLRSSLFGLPGLAGAAVLVTVGAVYLAFNYKPVVEQTAGVNPPVVIKETPVALPKNEVSEPKLPSPDVPKPEVVATNTASTREYNVRAYNVERKPKQIKNLTAESLPPATVYKDAPKQKAPALSTLEEDDDKSLRLADLFDEGGV